jgi:hypothetical protein
MPTSDSPLSIAASRTLQLVRAAAAVGNWVFQALGFLSPLPLTAVYPRPDAETRTTSRHRKAHTGMVYRLPIGVRAGCWPYRYQIISGPAGAVIGEELTRSVDSLTGKTLHTIGEDYGVITWDSSSATDGDAFSFTVRVTDQIGVSTDLVWSGNVDNAAFVFANSVTGNDANAGTQAAPLQTFASGLYKNSDTDATYAGKIAVCSGTLDINAGTLDTSPILNHLVKPVAFIGSGACTFNTSRGHFRTAGALDDPFFQGIDFNGARTDLPSNRIFNLSHTVSRPAFFECTFDNITKGTAGTDNPCCIGFFNIGSPFDEHIFISKCGIGDTCSSQLVVTFNSHNVLWERNYGGNVNLQADNGAFALHAKDNTSYLTIRANTFAGTARTGLIGIANQSFSSPLIQDQECCYNTLILNSAVSVIGAITWNDGLPSADGQNTHDYRNSVVTPTSRTWRILRSNISPYDPRGFGSVWYAGNGTGTTVLVKTAAAAPAGVVLAATDFDASGKLANSARTTHLGASGAELAGA